MTEPEIHNLAAKIHRADTYVEALEIAREASALSHDLEKVQTESDEDDQEIKYLREALRAMLDVFGPLDDEELNGWGPGEIQAVRKARAALATKPLLTEQDDDEESDWPLSMCPECESTLDWEGVDPKEALPGYQCPECKTHLEVELIFRTRKLYADETTEAE